MLTDNQQSFLSSASEAAKLISDEIEKSAQILIVSHFDADGIAAAAILSKALIRKNASIHTRIINRLNDGVLEELSRTSAIFLIFSDIGSGYLNILPKAIGQRKAIVLDHHQFAPNIEIPKNIFHVNPHLFELDGTTEISGSGLSYFVAKSIDEKNVDLSSLAIVGALGDIQDKGEKHSLFSLNGQIVEDGIETGSIKVETDLAFFGRETRPIHRAIAYTTNPFLPGLSGEEDKCFALLKSAGIPVKDGDRWRSLAELSQEEKQKLLSKAIEYLSSMGFSGNIVLDLIGTVYTLPKEEKWTPSRDAREYGTLLNACGRMGKQSLVLAFCLGERGPVVEEIQDILNEYRRTLAHYMDLLTQRKERIDDRGKVFIVHGEDIINENMTGAISTILSMTHQNTEKVILVITKTEEGKLKISGRASSLILKKGVNLGKTMQNLAEKFSGIGGGHDIAAGAEITPEGKSIFLNEFNKIILDQAGSP